MKETLWCKIGNHEWTRETTRGRKPIACPDHRVADPALILSEQRAQVSSSESKETPLVSQEKPSAALTEPQTPEIGDVDDEPVGSTRFHLTPLAQLRKQFHIDEESARILQYVEDQVNNNWPGGRKQGDITSLRKAYDLRLGQVMRGSRRVQS